MSTLLTDLGAVVGQVNSLDVVGRGELREGVELALLKFGRGPVGIQVLGEDQAVGLTFLGEHGA